MRISLIFNSNYLKLFIIVIYLQYINDKKFGVVSVFFLRSLMLTKAAFLFKNTVKMIVKYSYKLK